MKHKKLLLPLILCASLPQIAFCAPEAAPGPAGDIAGPSCTINLNSQKSVNRFDGLGALVSYGKLLYDYPQKQRDEILDYLFLPGYGASLQILKVELGYDGNNTAMSWPSYRREIDEKPVFDRGYGVWYMKEAKKRNPDIILSALHWGYPAWATTDRLKADFVADYVIGLHKEHGLHIDYIGGNQNESVITPGVTKLIRKKLDEAGLQDVKIICADEGARTPRFRVLDRMSEDKEYANVVDVIGVHYKGRPASFMPQKAYSFGKPIWSSEDGGGNYVNKSSGRQWTDQLMKLLQDVRITGVIRWLATASIYDNMPWPNNGIMKTKEPWSGHYEIGTNLWAFAHFTQFIKPGWRLMDTGSYLVPDGNGQGYGRYVAYCDPATGDYSVVITTYANLDAGGIDIRIKTDKKLKQGRLNVWRSHFESPEEQFIKVSEIEPDIKGFYDIHLDKDCVYTISTTTGQGKGSTSVPAGFTFPLPYEDSFDGYEAGRMPKYFVDAHGTFEISEMGGNKVLRQTIRHKPVIWHSGDHIAQPVSEIGDMKWKDYSVQIDAMLENEGSVMLGGRIDPYLENNQEYKLQGHWLYLNDKGEWKLTLRNKTEETVKASGKVSFGINEWTTLKLEMKGNRIAAFIGEEKVAEVTIKYPETGNVAIATLAPDADDFYVHTDLYTTVRYDNLTIKKL